ncbi:chaperone protein dnaJ 11, chloroplastic-like [Rhodamnia argentea]|uniref:Chaperone protein dnaJ 11, chloroplastic-like n=1 Tax=Rhodamnia argentea TaxID=178133 RepID=A0A8B8NPA9_9MYRT|nr:chaperone protein dnaJ 11, chloroplastic-like [Rhodamnia argentea]
MLSLSSPALDPPYVATARVRARRPSAISAATFTSSATSKSRQQHQYPHPPRLSHRSPPFATPYEILGIPAGATSEEIKAAYRRLARVLHPDAARDSSADLRFIRLHDAYSTLLDPEKRSVYDRRVLLARKRNRPVAVVDGASAYGGRNWETDQCW